MTHKYTMPISRLTVDKLGVKLYDRVSAVIAELIANSYDADASQVRVEAPMGEYLASKAGGNITDKGLEIVISDDGVGMTPEEMQQYFLPVGAERRSDPERGGDSPTPRFGRKVMGRKGVGKLAPFGICREIEVISSGGDRITDPVSGETGHRTSHIIMEYDRITSGDPYEDYPPTVGDRDETISTQSGTTVTLRTFNYRRVPDMHTLERQIAQRFGIRSEKWQIELRDSRRSADEDGYQCSVGEFALERLANTLIRFTPEAGQPTAAIGADGEEVLDLLAGFEHEGEVFPVSGWVAYSKVPYKDELMAGVRIYCRGKIAAQSAVFNRRAGFTGEHDVRSYLVGEIHADWLDEREDLILTDRRDILWSDPMCAAFETWGQSVVQRIGRMTREPMRRAKWEIFSETGRVEQRAKEAFPAQQVEDIRRRAVDMAKVFGQTISRADAEDPEVVDGLVDMSLTLAPHLRLTDMMREAASDANTPLAALVQMMRAARIAELVSFGQIVEDRLKVIQQLEDLTGDPAVGEGDLQDLIEGAPWLIDPEWMAVTANQSLSTLQKAFERYYKDHTKEDISLVPFSESRKRPDFVLMSQKNTVQIVEIKQPNHKLRTEEFDRIVRYHKNMDGFLDDQGNSEFRKVYGTFHITIVCDDTSGISDTAQQALRGWLNDSVATLLTWASFVRRTRAVHQDFLEEARRLQRLASASEEGA